MDIRQLHYFLVLCEEMNYTRAAQRLFLSRQALRQSISALEAELCGPLFLSAHHRLSLTDRGVSLQRHAAPVVEQFQQMQAALHAEIQSAQPVRIGISVSLVPDYLPGLETQLDKFRQQYPHIEMRFRLLDNAASKGLHLKCGFRLVGRRERSARDCHGRWLDTFLMERRCKDDEPSGYRKL